MSEEDGRRERGKGRWRGEGREGGMDGWERRKEGRMDGLRKGERDDK